MELPSGAFRLRIYVGEADKMHGRPLYECLVESARAKGMAGASVFRGIVSFGANSRIHTSKILRLSEDLPIVIEIVDKRERIDAFLPEVSNMVTEGLVTLEPVEVILYRHNTA